MNVTINTKNRYFRAIKLFELYVAIRLADRRPKRSKMPTTDSSLVSALLVNLSNKKMYDARMFAHHRNQ
jgi:hypothetical protein